MIVVYTLGDELDNHSAIAFTSTNQGPKYFSWAHTEHSFWFDRFVTKSGTWSQFYGRVLIPTCNDGNYQIAIDENDAVKWYNNYQGSTFSVDNCSAWCYRLLRECGATYYEPTSTWLFGTAWTPRLLGYRAEGIRDQVIAKLGGAANVVWPAHTNKLQVFFSKEKQLRNNLDWWQ
jgi:hypothetical protein